LYDSILENTRVEFITKMQKRRVYDFSIYNVNEKKALFGVLSQLK